MFFCVVPTPEADRGVCKRAIDSYVDVAKRDVLFDHLSRNIGNALATVGDVKLLPESLDAVIGTNTRVALNSAAPIYRMRVWPARQRDNEAWMASAKALLAQHETTTKATLARIYRVDWPSEPILVDVVGEVGPNSAITHGGPSGFAAHTQASAGSHRIPVMHPSNCSSMRPLTQQRSKDISKASSTKSAPARNCRRLKIYGTL